MNFYYQQSNQFNQNQITIQQPVAITIEDSTPRENHNLHLFIDDSKNIKNLDYNKIGSKLKEYEITEKNDIVYHGINSIDEYKNTFPNEIRARDYANNHNERPFLE